MYGHHAAISRARPRAEERRRERVGRRHRAPLAREGRGRGAPARDARAVARPEERPFSNERRVGRVEEAAPEEGALQGLGFGLELVGEGRGVESRRLASGG